MTLATATMLENSFIFDFREIYIFPGMKDLKLMRTERDQSPGFVDYSNFRHINDQTSWDGMHLSFGIDPAATIRTTKKAETIRTKPLTHVGPREGEGKISRGDLQDVAVASHELCE